jgi:hypothetical protein
VEVYIGFVFDTSKKKNITSSRTHGLKICVCIVTRFLFLFFKRSVDTKSCDVYASLQI